MPTSDSILFISEEGSKSVIPDKSINRKKAILDIKNDKEMKHRLLNAI